MSVRLLTGTYDGEKAAVVMVDSLNDSAFGPLLEDETEAEELLVWFSSGAAARAADGLGIASIANDDDPRGYRPGDLRTLVDHWRELQAAGLSA